jgi:hybrid cluster-associated redox disulfide protein
MPENQKINKEHLIAEIIKKNPKVVKIMESYGLHCVSCPFSEFETIEIGAAIHGIPEEKMFEMIEKINQKVEKSSGK